MRDVLGEQGRDVNAHVPWEGWLELLEPEEILVETLRVQCLEHLILTEIYRITL